MTSHVSTLIPHIAFINDVFSGVNREREMDISYDDVKMPIYTNPGSESSEYDQSFDKTEDTQFWR